MSSETQAERNRLRHDQRWTRVLTDAKWDLDSALYVDLDEYRETLRELAANLYTVAQEMGRVAGGGPSLAEKAEKTLGGGFRVDDRTPEVITDAVLKRRLEVYGKALGAALTRAAVAAASNLCPECGLHNDDLACECDTT